jgi:hypothetical protein
MALRTAISTAPVQIFLPIVSVAGPPALLGAEIARHPFEPNYLIELQICSWKTVWSSYSITAFLSGDYNSVFFSSDVL